MKMSKLIKKMMKTYENEYYEIEYKKMKRKLEANLQSKNSKLFLTNENKHRGIGKTQALIELSLNYSIPIVVKDIRAKKSIEERLFKLFEETCYDLFSLKPPEVILFNSLRNKSLNGVSKVLIDEGLTFEDIDCLREQCIQFIGFISGEINKVESL